MVPDPTLARKSDENRAKRFKVMKDIVTLLFCVNQTGNHKVKPLRIGKLMSLWCLHHKTCKT